MTLALVQIGAVQAAGDLIEIGVKVLGADPVMGADVLALEESPYALNRVCVRASAAHTLGLTLFGAAAQRADHAVAEADRRQVIDSRLFGREGREQRVMRTTMHHRRPGCQTRSNHVRLPGNSSMESVPAARFYPEDRTHPPHGLEWQ